MQEKFTVTKSAAPHQDHYVVINQDASVCFDGFFGHHGPHKFAQGPVLYEALEEIVAAADGDGWNQLDASFEKSRLALKLARGEV
jgi:hypothetical protein